MKPNSYFAEMLGKKVENSMSNLITSSLSFKDLVKKLESFGPSQFTLT
jgi:hypothetical protein